MSVRTLSAYRGKYGPRTGLSRIDHHIGGLTQPAFGESARIHEASFDSLCDPFQCHSCHIFFSETLKMNRDPRPRGSIFFQ